MVLDIKQLSEDELTKGLNRMVKDNQRSFTFSRRYGGDGYVEFSLPQSRTQIIKELSERNS